MKTQVVLALLLLCAFSAQEVQQFATELPGDLKTVETLKTYEPKATGPKRQRPVLGIRFGAYRKSGAKLPSVEAGSPAAAEGLLPGDLTGSHQRRDYCQRTAPAWVALKVAVGDPHGPAAAGSR
jgi:predicted metalloprotease with PDZ domain